MQKTGGKYPALFGSMKEKRKGEINKCYIFKPPKIRYSNNCCHKLRNAL